MLKASWGEELLVKEGKEAEGKKEEKTKKEAEEDLQIVGRNGEKR